MKRIAIAGKGGSGKTTIAGALTRLAARVRGDVLAIDGDPNPNLSRALGIPSTGLQALLPGDLLKYEMRDEKNVPVLTRSVADIVDTYGVAGPDRVRLLTMGEVEHVGKGCLCRSHAIVREVIGAALENPDRPVFLDMEASLEHMSRGTLRHIDALIIVTEPYYRSLESAGRLLKLAREQGTRQVFGVANKVRTPEEEAAIRTYFGNVGLELIAVVPYDEQVARADFENKALLDFAPASTSIRAIEGIVGQLFA